MTNKSEWQEANRRLTAEQREKLGDPPTAEEMLAYSRGELNEAQEERIRELLVAYPELARAYGAAFPEEPRQDDPDAAADEQTLESWNDLQRRLGTVPVEARGQRDRAQFRHYVPTTIAAAMALVFFGLYVQAEGRARQNEREGYPVVLGAAHELQPGGSRGPATPTMLHEDGDAYLLKLELINQVRYAHYRIGLDHEGNEIWTRHSAQPDSEGTFQIVIPHDFLRPGEHYRLHIFGVDGKTSTPLGTFDLAVPAE